MEEGTNTTWTVIYLCFLVLGIYSITQKPESKWGGFCHFHVSKIKRLRLS